jgi:hypothetical protein
MPNNAIPRPEKSASAHKVQPRKGSAAVENEGEGSRTAARNYNKATEQYVKSGRVDEAAKKAEAALDGPEGDELREAELETRRTEPGKEPSNPKAPGRPEGQEEQGFQEPDLMKDASEDRE